jgi:hypothetical protein
MKYSTHKVPLSLASNSALTSHHLVDRSIAAHVREEIRNFLEFTLRDARRCSQVRHTTPDCTEINMQLRKNKTRVVTVT